MIAQKFFCVYTNKGRKKPVTERGFDQSFLIKKEDSIQFLTILVFMVDNKTYVRYNATK